MRKRRKRTVDTPVASAEAVLRAIPTLHARKTRFPVTKTPPEGKRRYNPSYAHSWYPQKVQDELGVLPSRYPGDFRLVYRRYIRPIFGHKLSKAEWDEFYEIMGAIIERWPEFVRKTQKKNSPFPDHPPLGWAPGWWATWRGFVRERTRGRTFKHSGRRDSFL